MTVFMLNTAQGATEMLTVDAYEG